MSLVENANYRSAYSKNLYSHTDFQSSGMDDSVLSVLSIDIPFVTLLKILV